MRHLSFCVFLLCLWVFCHATVSAQQTPPGSITWEDEMTPEEQAEFDRDFADPDPAPPGSITWYEDRTPEEQAEFDRDRPDSSQQAPPGSITWEDEMTPEERSEFDRDFADPDPAPPGSITWYEDMTPEEQAEFDRTSTQSDPPTQSVQDPRMDEGNLKLLTITAEISSLSREVNQIRKRLDEARGEDRTTLSQQRDDLVQKIEGLQRQRTELARELEPIQKETRQFSDRDKSAPALTATQEAFVKGIHSDGLGLILADVKAKGNMPRLMTELVELLFLHDHPLMGKATADREYTFEDGQRRERQVNRRVDDSGFKERLLSILRKYIEPDSPQQKRLIESFAQELDPMTQMRIVRAIRKTGGKQARDFCDHLQKTAPDSPAGQEAARGVE